MYFKDKISYEEPMVEEPWGEKYKNISLNIKKYKANELNMGFDIPEDDTVYMFDYIEKVPVPITVDNIVKTAIEGNFNKEFIDYVHANIFKQDDPKVKEYIAFAQAVNNDAVNMGY